MRDVSLIKVPVSLSNVLALRDRPAETLEQVYAIGSPPGEDLQSSVTQGNVIGISTATLVGASSQNVNLVVPISSAIERLNLTVSAGPTGQETEQGPARSKSVRRLIGQACYCRTSRLLDLLKPPLASTILNAMRINRLTMPPPAATA